MAAFVSDVTATAVTGAYVLVSGASVTASTEGDLLAAASGFAAAIGVCFAVAAIVTINQ